MTTPPRLTDRVTVLGSVDLTGFAPFLSPIMFSVNENLWSTTALIGSLVAILLIALVIVGRHSGSITPASG
jgi:hypothetical protein